MAKQTFDSFGFQRLVLLGSAGYSRAELPLDESVSLIAPNNTGKTSLINAMQFLLIINKQRMDFGAHDVDKSRRFYFPNNSAYIMLEASLPSSGTVVIGCVGKGVSHDFQYFAYKGQLNLDEFRTDEGTVVNQPALIAHMAKHGKLVHFYSSTDFAKILYGNRVNRSASEPDFTVFKLENARDADAYQRVLTRTLRLDRLKSKDVKEHLLHIFKHDVTDSSIDFKQAWDKAFADINFEREQYNIAVQHIPLLDALEKNRDDRLQTRGQIIATRPLIEAALEGWEQYYNESTKNLNQQVEALEAERRERLLKDRKLTEERTQLSTQLSELSKEQAAQDNLEQQFALINNREQLQQQHDNTRKQYEDITARILQVSTRSLSQITRDIEQNRNEQKALARELETLSDNLWQTLQAELTPEHADKLNRLFNRDVMTLGNANFKLNADQLSSVLSRMQPDQWYELGLELNMGSLSPQHVVKSADEIRLRQSELTQKQDELHQQLSTAQSLEKSKEEQDTLYTQLDEIKASIQRFDRLLMLREQQPERERMVAEVKGRIENIEGQLAELENANDVLDRKSERLNGELSELKQKHNRIDTLRNQRIDGSQHFEYLDERQHLPWIDDRSIQPQNLADALENYQRTCQRLVSLERDIHNQLNEIHHHGFTKFNYAENEESETDALINFRHQLQKESEALERRARTAVVNVTASLRDLRGGLHSLKRRMKEFNSLIGARQLSDLKVFKIETQDDELLVSAIDTLIETASKVESGETFTLFNQSSVLDDEQLNRARQRLIDECNARQGLRVADLFQLSFVVGKMNAAPESFDDLDSAASNGTVLMAKLVTGLAMLHLMQDKRHRVKALCYLDEALALDTRNQESLIDTAAVFGFSLIFASPAPLTTARYCVPILEHNGKNLISRESWHILEPLTSDSDESPLSNASVEVQRLDTGTVL